VVAVEHGGDVWRPAHVLHASNDGMGRSSHEW
jgi:hypothetical protein